MSKLMIVEDKNVDSKKMKLANFLHGNTLLNFFKKIP